MHHLHAYIFICIHSTYFSYSAQYFRILFLFSYITLYNSISIDLARKIKRINDVVRAAGKKQHKDIRKRKHVAAIRTWREWVEAEGSDTSQYFTMDYSHVRRRRPIHNKSLPVAP